MPLSCDSTSRASASRIEVERRAHRDHFEDLRLAVAQQIGETAVGDVARDAGDAEDVAARVAHRHLGRQKPGLAARMVVEVLLEVDHRPAAADDLLLVVEELLRDLQRQQLEVALADHIGGLGEAHARRSDLVADHEAALDVLDPQVIVQAIDQRLQRNALVEPGALVAQFGDVLVSRNPAAARKRLPPDRERSGRRAACRAIRATARRRASARAARDNRRPPAARSPPQGAGRRSRARWRRVSGVPGRADRARRSGGCRPPGAPGRRRRRRLAARLRSRRR